MSRAVLRGGNTSNGVPLPDNLYGADLSKADLRVVKIVKGNQSEYIQIHFIQTDFSNPELIKSELAKAYLSGDDLVWTNLIGADLRKAKFHDSVLIRADLSGANLSGATLEEALTLVDTNLRGVKGLTKEQLEACKAKGAIIDDDPTASAFPPAVASFLPSQSNDARASSAPSAQGSPPPPDPDESNTNSSQPAPES